MRSARSEFYGAQHNAAQPARAFLALVTFILWFLLSVLAARPASAQAVSVLPASDLLPAIEAALMTKGIPADAEITLAEPQIAVAVAPNAEPQIEHVSVNPATGRFLVRINGTAISGFAKVAARYPALIEPMARGEIIAPENIEWIETADARPDAVTDADELTGMEARRGLAAGAPLRKSDVAAPVLVKRGGLVTMTYVAAGLSLSEQGVAQATGAMGEVVEVKNVKSDRVIRAVIDGKDRVKALSPRFARSEQ